MIETLQRVFGLAGISPVEVIEDKSWDKMCIRDRDFNYIDIIEMLEKMMGSASADRQEILNKVYDNIQNFEYDAAYEILNNITEN